MFSQSEARQLLTTAKVFFDDDDEPNFKQTLNLNDIWGWACADGENVMDEDLPEVADLFWRYGFAGILYWVSEKRGGLRSEFSDNNRFIDFVRQEEKLRQEVPDSSKRAYKKLMYTLGEEPTK